MSRWVEVAPRGPQKHGHVGGDVQVTEGWGRRWIKRHPKLKNYAMVIEDVVYGCEENDRRWIQTQVNGYLMPFFPDERLSEAEVSLEEQVMQEFHDSAEDREATDNWPTDKDLKAELRRSNQPLVFTWNGESW